MSDDGVFAGKAVGYNGQFNEGMQRLLEAKDCFVRARLG